MMTQQAIPKRIFGKTGVSMPILSLGGAWALADPNNRKEAVALIQEAIELGIYYLDTAVSYRASEDFFGEAIQGRRERVYLSTKSDRRDYEGAMRDLENSLKRLRTDHLDQWIVHHVSYPHEVEQLFAHNGAIKAFQKAKEQKMARFIGVSGHNDPQVLIQMLERFPFDMVLVPLNPTEAHHSRSFIRHFLPVAQQHKVGIAVMKVLGIGRLVGESKLSVQEAFRYALSYPVHTAVVVPGNREQLRQLVQAAREFKPLSPDEMKALEARARPLTREIADVYHAWP
jgi:aryl-alcohol dehydrogenase-like predicted oxidoreductase